MEKKCYVYYNPNGGVWPDGSSEPKPTPINGGMMTHGDKFVYPEGAYGIKKEGYRHQTSQNYLNIPRFYTADGKGGGFDPEKICNGFGYDCWPHDCAERTGGGHDANWLGLNGMPHKDGDRIDLYVCWDPVITYHIGENVVCDFLYKTGGDEYTILGGGGKTGYSLNRMETNLEGYNGPDTLPDIKVEKWVDKEGNEYIVGKEYTVTEPLDLYLL